MMRRNYETVVTSISPDIYNNISIVLELMVFLSESNGKKKKKRGGEKSGITSVPGRRSE